MNNSVIAPAHMVKMQFTVWMRKQTLYIKTKSLSTLHSLGVFMPDP